MSLRSDLLSACWAVAFSRIRSAWLIPPGCDEENMSQWLTHDRDNDG